jgi:hypothetical protein
VVNGRMGNRKWADEAAAEKKLDEWLEDEAYTYKLISPAEAEKKLKKSPERWAVAQALITQAEGSKSLVRDDSPKQAVATNHAEFPLQAPA